MNENPYIGISPVSYDEYYTIMSAQLKGRFPLKIPKPVIENALKDIVGIDDGKKTLVASSIGGTGFFIYGGPGTGKTFLSSKMANMLPPILIPKYIAVRIPILLRHTLRAEPQRIKPVDRVVIHIGI